MFECPICLSKGLIEDPAQECSTHEICSTCGTHLGYEDGGGPLEDRKRRWVEMRAMSRVYD